MTRILGMVLTAAVYFFAVDSEWIDVDRCWRAIKKGAELLLMIIFATLLVTDAWERIRKLLR